MKVKIGPYKNWIGPYQIADALCFWARKETDEYGFKSKPQWVHNFGTWLSGGEDQDSWLQRACLWIESKRSRKIKVRIDRWDTWSMDHTLSYIVLPMLKQLNKTKHGAPFVDDEDVPEYLRSTAAEPKENEWDTDSNHFLRWNASLMIPGKKNTGPVNGANLTLSRLIKNTPIPRLEKWNQPFKSTRAHANVIGMG